MVYLIEHKNDKGTPKSSAIVSAFFAPHALDIYQFIVDIEDDDVVNIVELGEGFIDKPIYIEINRFNEFVNYSLKKIEPSKKGNCIKTFIVTDEILNVYKITKNTII